MLGLPEANTEMEVLHILDTSVNQSIKRVSVVGNDVELKWSLKIDEFVFTIPEASMMDEIATFFKVEFKK